MSDWLSGLFMAMALWSSVCHGEKIKEPDDDLVTTIYGADDRREIFEVQRPAVQQAARASVMLIESSQVRQLKDNYFVLHGENYGQSVNLCPSEKFYDQTAYGFCSGILIAPDLVLTAGHCVINKDDCRNTRFVFDAWYERHSKFRPIIHGDQVRSCKSILKRSNRSNGMDYALLRLDSPVQHRSVSIGIPSSPGEVFMIGYPMGLPGKFSGDAHVFSETESGWEWLTDLDSSSGNSGSPVFESKTGRLLGILTAGDDGEGKRKRGGKSRQCQSAIRCTVDTCVGERVLKIETIKEHAQVF